MQTLSLQTARGLVDTTETKLVSYGGTYLENQSNQVFIGISSSNLLST